MKIEPTFKLTVDVPVNVVSLFVDAINRCHDDEDGYRPLTVKKVVNDKKSMTAIKQYLKRELVRWAYVDTGNLREERWFDRMYNDEDIEIVYDIIERVRR